MQPSGVRINTAPAPSQPLTVSSFSLNDTLDAIKREYNSLASEVIGIRNQRDELEVKRTFLSLYPHFCHSFKPFLLLSVESQVTELTSVRRSLFDLETQHSRVRQQFEEEVSRMRAELNAIRQQQPSSNNLQPTANAPVGIADVRSPRPSSGTPPNFSDPQQSQRRRSLIRDRPPSVLDTDRVVDQPSQTIKITRGERDEGDTSERGLDSERLADPRDPKRHKARRDHLGITNFSFLSTLICLIL